MSLNSSCFSFWIFSEIVWHSKTDILLNWFCVFISDLIIKLRFEQFNVRFYWFLTPSLQYLVLEFADTWPWMSLKSPWIWLFLTCTNPVVFCRYSCMICIPVNPKLSYPWNIVSIFQIRLYPRLSNLDNAFASEIRLTCSPFLINILDNILLVYCSDCKLTFYSLDKAEGESGLSSFTGVTDDTGLEFRRRSGGRASGIKR
jgi:hypothetical protein